MAKQQIRNENELDNLLVNAMYEAIDYTMQKMFEENSDLIDKYVYDAYAPEYYDRSEEFRDAWNYYTKRSVRLGKKGLKKGPTGEFYYDPGVMHYIPDLAQHGTPSGRAMEASWLEGHNQWAWTAVESAWGDARQYLAEILYEGKGGPLFGDGPWRKKRDAWSQLVKKMGQGKIFTWFEEGMAKQGLKVYKR